MAIAVSHLIRPVFAQEADAPVDAVVRKLIEREVAVFRADTSWFPGRLMLDAHLDSATGRWTGELRTEHRRVELGAIRSIWYRDPAAFRFPTELTDVERAYAHREARLGFGGVLRPPRAADAGHELAGGRRPLRSRPGRGGVQIVRTEYDHRGRGRTSPRCATPWSTRRRRWRKGYAPT
jgi:hypothetical protein